MLVRRKYVGLKATQWNKVGDHGKVVAYANQELARKTLEFYFPNGLTPNVGECYCCKHLWGSHGWLPSSNPYKTGDIVCPGDWILEDQSGITISYSAESNLVFNNLYEEVKDEPCHKNEK